MLTHYFRSIKICAAITALYFCTKKRLEQKKIYLITDTKLKSNLVTVTNLERLGAELSIWEGFGRGGFAGAVRTEGGPNLKAVS